MPGTRGWRGVPIGCYPAWDNYWFGEGGRAWRRGCGPSERGLRTARCFPAAYYAGLDCDAAVDARDRDGEFDLAWVRACDAADRLWSGATIGPELRVLAEDIRREGF